MRPTRKCEFCGKTFVPRSGMQKYCSEECQAEAKRLRKKRQQDLINGIEPIMDLQHQEYLTFSKAAILMGCTRQYIYKLVANGKLKASRLSSLMQEEGFCKQYYAVCCGKLPDKNGEFVDYLLKDGKNNVSKVVKEGTAGAKYAKLLYETLKEIEKDDKVYTLVKVTLITGRHHQIRVQFAHRNHPLLGDTKYGEERFNNEIALCAAFLSVDGHEYSIEPSWQF